MRRTLIGLAFLCGAMFSVVLATSGVDPQSVTPVMLASPYSAWTEIGLATESESPPATLTYTAVSSLVEDVNVVTWTLPNYARKVQLSFQTTADADSQVVDLIGFAGDGYSRDTSNALVSDTAVWLGRLALTGGKLAAGNSNYYVDTISVTDANGLGDFTVYDSGHDRRAVVEFNPKVKTIKMFASTLASKTELHYEGRLVP